MHSPRRDCGGQIIDFIFSDAPETAVGGVGTNRYMNKDVCHGVTDIKRAIIERLWGLTLARDDNLIQVMLSRTDLGRRRV